MRFRTFDLKQIAHSRRVSIGFQFKLEFCCSKIRMCIKSPHLKMHFYGDPFPCILIFRYKEKQTRKNSSDKHVCHSETVGFSCKHLQRNVLPPPNPKTPFFHSVFACGIIFQAYSTHHQREQKFRNARNFHKLRRSTKKKEVALIQHNKRVIYNEHVKVLTFMPGATTSDKLIGVKCTTTSGGYPASKNMRWLSVLLLRRRSDWACSFSAPRADGWTMSICFTLST